MYLKIYGILTSFVARQRMQSVFTETFTNQVLLKDNMIYVIDINVKNVNYKNYQAHRIFKIYCIFLVAEIMNASI